MSTMRTKNSVRKSRRRSTTSLMRLRNGSTSSESQSTSASMKSSRIWREPITRVSANLSATFEAIKKDVRMGFFEKAWNKIKAVVNAIIDFATRIVELLGESIDLVGDIISSPRAFFRNLATGIGGGFSEFVDESMSSWPLRSLIGFAARAVSRFKSPKSGTPQVSSVCSHNYSI